MKQDSQPIYIVGVGPGHPAYLTLRAVEVIQQADMVAGFASVLRVVEARVRSQKLVMTYANQEAVLEKLAQASRTGKRCVVCVAGDSDVSAGELVDRVRATGRPVEVVPGISSIQVAAARMGIALEESLVISLHKRADIKDDLAELAAELRQGRRNLFVLPHPTLAMPAQIASYLEAAGISKATPVWVLEKLTQEGEALTRSSLAELAAGRQTFSDLSIIVFPRLSSALQSRAIVI